MPDMLIPLQWYFAYFALVNQVFFKSTTFMSMKNIADCVSTIKIKNNEQLN